MLLTVLNQIWQPIKSLLVKIGRVQTVIIMAVVYFIIIGPVAILFQIFHRQKPASKTYWIKKDQITDMDFYLKKQF